MRNTEFVHHVLMRVAVVAVTVLILMALSYLATPVRESQSLGVRYTSAYGFDQLQRNSVDVLFVGDSSIESGVNNLALQEAGISSYNSGSPNQTVMESRDIVAAAFRTQSPRVVVLDANEVFAGSTKTADALLDKAEDLFPVLRYHSDWKQLLGARPQQVDLSALGYKASDAVKPYTGGDYMGRTKGDASMPRWAVSYYDEIARICQEHGAQLVLVNVPNAKQWNGSYHDAVQAYATDRGLDYVDLNTRTADLSLDWSTDTRDGGDHLNTSGANKVTAWLASYLQSPSTR